MLKSFIGNTPLRRLDVPGGNVYVKLEYNNYSGSIKDRAAHHILSKALERGEIGPGTTVIESSSGNFAIALSSICRMLGLRSIMVIDSNINSNYEKALRILADEVIKVTTRDPTGGFLLTRIEKVKELCATVPDAYWPNQYENQDNYLAYYEGLGEEICGAFDTLDYAFIAASTCGTITGLSKRLRERFPTIKVIAVDVEGSIIFQPQPGARHISGLGASKKSPLLSYASIDEVVLLSELDIVRGARSLLSEQGIFGGASAGAMYAAAWDRLTGNGTESGYNAVFLCPDRGNAYLDNIYNEQWVLENLCKKTRV